MHNFSHLNPRIARRAARLMTPDSLIAVLVGIVALSVYLATLAPGVISIADDSLEFQLLALRGAIPHP
ncbi:MAG: hypothetical protein ACRDIB_00975, partial [Ardenticatenaceae bacterium]